MGDCFQFLLGSNYDDKEKPAKTKSFGPFHFDLKYLHSGPGLVKCAQVVSRNHNLLLATFLVTNVEYSIDVGDKNSLGGRKTIFYRKSPI